jgi:hypothetical protein
MDRNLQSAGLAILKAKRCTQQADILSCDSQPEFAVAGSSI